MAVTLNASTSTGYIQTADTSGDLALQSNGTTQFTVSSTGAYGQIKSGTSVTASGTSVDFTGIPSWVKRITVMFSGVSTSGTSIRQIQLGYSGGVETSGYTGSVAITNSAGGGGNTAFSGAGFAITASGNTLAADTMNGSIVFVNLSGNVWVGTGTFVSYNQPCSFYISGAKTTTGTLDRVRITTVNGTDTFDAGTINILYEG